MGYQLGRVPPTPGPSLDAVDETIVWQLVRDARTSITALAGLAGVAPSTCHARVKHLQETGVVESFHAKTNLEALGLPLQAVVSVRLRAQARDQIREYAHRTVLLPQVINLFFIGGPDDFLIHVACASSAQLRDFVAAYLSMDQAVASTSTSIVFDHLVGAQNMEHLEGLAQMRAEIG
jgi:DNA-binding Lrp family transcriptional regulator